MTDAVTVLVTPIDSTQNVVRRWATAVASFITTAIVLYGWAVGAFDAARNGTVPPPLPIVQSQPSPTIIVIGSPTFGGLPVTVSGQKQP